MTDTTSGSSVANTMASPDTPTSRYAVGLDTLPLEIKLQILEHLPDISSLSNLILASRPFYDTYKRYKRTTSAAVLLHDISTEEEAREAELLVKSQPFLTNDIEEPIYSMRDIRNFIDDHYASNEDHFDQFNPIQYIVPPPKPWFSMSSFVKKLQTTLEEEYTDHLVKNHNTVRYLTNLFFEKRLGENWWTPEHINLDPSPPTDSEQHRVRVAIYRLWILIILSNIYTDDPDQQWYDPYIKTYKVNRDEFCQILHSYDFWAVRDIFAVYNFILRILRPYHMAYLPEAEKEAEERFFNELGYRGHIVNVHDGNDYGGDYHPWMLTRLLIWNLPSGITNLLRYNHAPSSTFAAEKMEQIRRYHGTRPFTYPEDTAEFNYLLNSYNGSIDGLPGDPHGYDDDEREDWDAWVGMTITPRRLFMSPGGKYSEDGVEWIFGDSSTVDLHACVWDDWRLEASGYHEYELLGRGVSIDYLGEEYYGGDYDGGERGDIDYDDLG